MAEMVFVTFIFRSDKADKASATVEAMRYFSGDDSVPEPIEMTVKAVKEKVER